ncbi:hypothetical protein LC653_45945 [Nostoc sp. CHAB 5784]|uniref:hypothetical protein n=1 Tax=Nostoc mirabile TaxID=2907820 RepID=UPI001E3F34B6|nr:hypothetical protein [Nostoc mirabile]MCC5670902.1 hypothetical protein [Nostoc mirabile CHAB5784]
MPASKNARSTFRSKFRRSLISCSVSSGTSTALAVIVANAGFSSCEISSRSWSSDGMLSLNVAEVAFLRLRGGAASQHLNSFGQYEKGLNGRVQADCLATMGANSGYVFIAVLSWVQYSNNSE